MIPAFLSLVAVLFLVAAAAGFAARRGWRHGGLGNGLGIARQVSLRTQGETITWQNLREPGQVRHIARIPRKEDPSWSRKSYCQMLWMK